MDNQLNKRYGLFTAIAMVIGIVIGSGVFFKAETVLKTTGGNMPLGILAWGIVGLIMIICSYTFAVLASKFERVNGIVDYADVAVGSKYGYYVGWFMTMIYMPSISSVLSWVSARYTAVLLGWDITGGSAMTLACLYLVSSYSINAVSPILAGKFQVSTTIIKLVPLMLMAIIGTIAGFTNGMVIENFSKVINPTVSITGGLSASIVSVAFAYEGWIIATSINAELKDAKKNLPIALMLGSLIVVFVYISYYIGLSGAVPSELLMESGQTGVMMAFQNIFGQVGGTLIFVFVIISCLGSLNGVMLGSTRGMYSIASRNEGPYPELFIQVDKVTNMPTNSAIFGLLLSTFWLVYFYGANLTESWFGSFSFDSSELPIITLYGAYIPIFIMMMKKGEDLNVFKRYVMPILSILSCIFMVIAAYIAHGEAVLYYLIIFAIIMIIGSFFYRKRKSN
ncbi:APC family permease [Tissierella creatinini]|nr:APC family permease [Tissierella creatinini]TJX66638.1 APC family permease [Soehngenia saccharolytica]